MTSTPEREHVRFDSAGTECAAWHYPGTTGACAIMAGGFAVTKEPGTDRFARRFHRRGAAPAPQRSGQRLADSGNSWRSRPN